MTDSHKLAGALRRIEENIGVELIAYNETTDDTPFGLDVIERLEKIDAAGVTIPKSKTPVRLTARQVARLIAIEERHGVPIIGYDPRADWVIFGEGTVRNLAKARGIDI